jgi:hypothetical protein
VKNNVVKTLPRKVDFTGVDLKRTNARGRQSRNASSGPCLILSQWLERDIDPLDALLGDLFSTTSRVLFFADTGVGKTMLALSWAFAMSFGRKFMHWRAKRKARVLYVDGEMPRDLMKERLEVMCKIFELKPTEIAHSQGLTVLSSEDFEDMQPLNEKAGQQWLDDFMHREGPFDFVIFDNITSLCTGIMKEEDSWQAVKPYTLELTKRHVGQLRVHHTGHDTTRGYGTKTREWQMDTVVTAEQVSKDHIDFNLLFPKKRRSKPSNYEDFQDVHLELIDEAWRTGVVVEKPTGRPNKSEKVALQALRSSGGSLSENEWREYSFNLGISASPNEKARQKAFARARDGLIDKGMVKSVEDRYVVA